LKKITAQIGKESRPAVSAKKVVSLHPVIGGDKFFWERGVWDKKLFKAVKNAAAVILPQTVNRELYTLCTKICPHVFPNYELRFQWEGKIGDTLAFWTYGMKHPRTIIFPKVETLEGNHPHMALEVPSLPPYPFVLKGAYGGEGRQIWLIRDHGDLDTTLQILRRHELQGKNGFVIQEYLPSLDRDLRVVVIGTKVLSYWRKSEGFRHNVAQGGIIDTDADPDLQAAGRHKVKQFCRLSGINLAAFDLVFPPGDKEPVFLEINYTFGRTGLGGSENFYTMLQGEVEQWLQDDVWR